MMVIHRLAGVVLLVLTLLLTSFYAAPASRPHVQQFTAAAINAAQTTFRYGQQCSEQLSRGSLGCVPRDPTRAPGWIEGKRWVSADPDAQMHDWAQRMIEREDSGEMDWARNKTILFLGDSVVRDLIWTWCDDMIRKKRVLVKLDDSIKGWEKTQGWLCRHPTYNLSMINGFIYGMTDYSRYNLTRSPNEITSREWPAPPWSFEDRLPELKEQYDRFNADIIFANSGAWDFKFMYRRELKMRLPSSSIDPEELHGYGERLRKYFRLLRHYFPQQKIVWMQLHPMSSEDEGARWYWAQGLHPQVNGSQSPNATIVSQLPELFTRRRLAQLGSTYRQVAAEEQVDFVDYWKIAEATEPGTFIREGDAIHPAKFPSIRIMMDMVLEKVHRLAVYNV
ncbi:hypothetical protein CALVIDRAFT_558448 [Calocera viscosa TUFC12733]|uniref:SGNH hydrolase-type esterase domain-containing protein n=1 Tax=Calocera viscosa (strain TUFC12733) TaxID=1330018 RepID=A0A167GRF7_CALVF|nr:hypothetical protein CALVIDRAFT_558448 [Calocera viscosa TUFC12733]